MSAQETAKQSTAKEARATKKDKVRIIDGLAAVLGGSQASARSALGRANLLRTRSGNRMQATAADLWRLTGVPSGKYLAATMAVAPNGTTSRCGAMMNLCNYRDNLKRRRATETKPSPGGLVCSLRLPTPSKA